MIGTKIGQYRVLQLLGEGGMGRVLLAEHVLMKTRHAIKMLHDQLSLNDMIVQRFINEARAAGAIGHRNVIEITHVDQVEGGGPWYLVMKYLEGQTLTGFLASRNAPIDQRLIVHIIGEACNGLQAAHDRQIIHRDLKPDNLYLTAVKGDPYRTIILDFGVAQLGHDAGLVTRTGAVIGTPQYMAPEQHRGAAIDHRTDLWAMGAIVYEMATGRLPFEDAPSERNVLTGPELFHRMMTRPVVDPRYYQPAITEAFARAILMALEVDPARRLASARAFALMLADGTPGDGYQPSGLELLKTHADELLERGHGLETLRWQVPAMDSSPGARAAGQPLAAPSPPPGAPPPPPGAGWPMPYAPAPPPSPAAAAVVRLPPPMSTLGAMASQAAAVAPRAGSRRPLLATGIAVVAAAAILIVIVARQKTPATTRPGEARVSLSDMAIADAPPPARKDAAVAAVRVVDAGMPDVPPVAATATRDAAVAPINAPALAAHPPDAAVPEAAITPAPTEPIATGRLKVVILPWAEVWVDGKRLGQTPVRARLSVGPHRVRLKNDAREKTITVTVSSARTTVIDETW